MNLNELSEHMEKFADERFPHTIEQHGLISGEEVGEVQRAILKQVQGIRGTFEYWQEELEKEIAEAITALCGLAGHIGMNLEARIEQHLKRLETIDFSTPRKPHE